MLKKPVKILSIEQLTHNVIRMRIEKPKALEYTAGQAVNISINEPIWCDRKNAFSLTSIPEDDYIEFVIRILPEPNGFLSKLITTKPGDELIVHEAFAGLPYKGEGIFIAGGVGVAPFISILKSLQHQNKLGNNKLIFANRTSSDVFLAEHFTDLLGDRFINILSDEKHEEFDHGYISTEFIQKHITEDLKYFYICGSLPMVDFVASHISALGVEEEFILKEGY